MRGLDFTAHFVIVFLFLQRDDLRLGQDELFLRNFFFQCLESFAEALQAMS